MKDLTARAMLTALSSHQDAPLKQPQPSANIPVKKTSVAAGAAAVIVAGLIGSLMWRKASQVNRLPLPSKISAMVAMDNPLASTHQHKNIIAHAGIRPGMQVLDAGCGPGRLTMPIADHLQPDGKITALDLQQDMLKKVKVTADARQLSNIEYHHAALGDSTLPANRFDRAIMASVLGEIPLAQQAAAMKELYTCLKPDGQLGIVEIISDPHFQSEKDVDRLTSTAGFKPGATSKNTLFGSSLAYHKIFIKEANHDENYTTQPYQQ